MIDLAAELGADLTYSSNGRALIGDVEYVYASSADALRGSRFDEFVVYDGSFHDRKDADEILEQAKICVFATRFKNERPLTLQAVEVSIERAWESNR